MNNGTVYTHSFFADGYRSVYQFHPLEEPVQGINAILLDGVVVSSQHAGELNRTSDVLWANNTLYFSEPPKEGVKIICTYYGMETAFTSTWRVLNKERE